jgi:Carbohydrate-selective porin
MPDRSVFLTSLLLMTLLRITTAGAQSTDDPAASRDGGSAAWIPQVLGTQVNVIAQHLPTFHSAYNGPMSFTASGSDAISHVYGVYTGARIQPGLEAYLDVEMARGKGISHASGLAGVPNGDVLRQGTADLGNGPYVARAFIRYSHALRDDRADTLSRGADQLPSVVASERFQIDAGKFAVSDLFDVNRYANSTRLQFMNWGLFQNTAWDFAADTRGYTNGVAVALITRLWTARIGSFQMPKQANGNKFDGSLRRASGSQAELSLNLLPHDGVVRLLGFFNQARMGDYQEALDRAAGANAPSIVADDRPGRKKYGFGVNVEQPLLDDGETGVFARWGWNDGKTESFAFTEVEGHLSGGLQLSGAHWGRQDDRFGLAGVRHTIGSLHQQYLAHGGIGFLLGDGALNYGPETILETYYRAQLGKYFELGPDLQYVKNPGYNRDRGPASIFGLRLNFRY